MMGFLRIELIAFRHQAELQARYQYAFYDYGLKLGQRRRSSMHLMATWQHAMRHDSTFFSAYLVT